MGRVAAEMFFLWKGHRAEGGAFPVAKRQTWLLVKLRSQGLSGGLNCGNARPFSSGEGLGKIEGAGGWEEEDPR